MRGPSKQFAEWAAHPGNAEQLEAAANAAFLERGRGAFLLSFTTQQTVEATELFYMTPEELLREMDLPDPGSLEDVLDKIRRYDPDRQCVLVVEDGHPDLAVYMLRFQRS